MVNDLCVICIKVMIQVVTLDNVDVRIEAICYNLFKYFLNEAKVGNRPIAV